MQFDLDKLRKLIIPRDGVPPPNPPTTRDVLVCDYARSSGPRSDETAICAARTFLQGDVKHYYVRHVDAYRYGIREIAPAVVRMAAKYGADRVSVERLSNWELLQDAIIREAKDRSATIEHLSFFKPNKERQAKARRMSRLLTLCDAGLIHFVMGSYIDALFSQLQNFSFSSITNHCRADDVADSVSLLVTHC
jgi:phage terminase large subunit-like protein